MPALASTDDVKRILRLTDTNASRDAEIRAALDSVLSWADSRIVLAGTGRQVETYFDVYEDATLRLPVGDLTVTMVKIFEYPASDGYLVSPIQLGLGNGYDITDDGSLYLRPLMGVTPFEGAWARRGLRMYSRVEVYYEGSGVVPRALTEGIAMLAAGYWNDGPSVLSGLKSEKIGDYSYTSDTSVDPATGKPAYEKSAMWFLKPYMKKARVMVT